MPTPERGSKPRLLHTLPDELALLCLVRVPVKRHGCLRAVCSAWRAMVDSTEFQRTRKEHGQLEKWVILLTSENPVAMSRISAEMGDDAGALEIDEQVAADGAGATGPFAESDCVIRCHVLDVGQGAWATVPVPDEIAYACNGFGGTFYDGKLYLFAGESWDTANSGWCEAWSYDPYTNAWCSLAEMSHGRAKFVCESVGDEIFCVGGLWSPPCEAYHPKTNSWRKLDGPSGFSIPLGVVIEDVLYTWSWLSQSERGWADMEIRAHDAAKLDAEWVEAIRRAYMAIMRIEHPVLLYANKRLFALSQWRTGREDDGAGNGEGLQSWERLQLKVYDRASKQWESVGMFPMVPNMYDMARIDNTLYIVLSSLAVVEVDLDSIGDTLRCRRIYEGDIKRDLSNCIVPASLRCSGFEI